MDSDPLICQICRKAENILEVLRIILAESCQPGSPATG